MGFNYNIIFLQDLIEILQENYLANISFKVLARFFYILQENIPFLVQVLQDLLQDLASLARKCFVQDLDIFARQFLLGYEAYEAYLANSRSAKILLSNCKY